MSRRRYRWGIVGTSKVASDFVRQLRNTEQGVPHAVASRSLDRARQFAGKHGIDTVCDSLSALLADDQVDVLYIATPSRDHLEHCLSAVDADKAILCEKPLALNHEQGVRIARAARERGVFCMEAMWMRFHPLVQHLRQLVQVGQLGEIHYLRAELGWPKETSRVERPELGRGARLDFGVYPLSFAHFLLGVPERVEGFARKHSAGGDETVAAQLIYPGCVASVAASVSAELGNDALVVGSKASARLGRPLLSPRWLEVIPRDARSPNVIERALSRAASTWRLPAHVGFRREAEEVMRCLDSGKTESEVNPLDATLWVLSCADLIAATTPR